MLAFIHEHTPCGACFGVTVRLAEEQHRRYHITCSGCHAEFTRPLPGPDARYAIILQGVALLCGN